MLIQAITFYDVVLTVHILAVVVAFGVVFSYPVIDGYVRSTTPAALPALHNLHVLLATKVITPAMTVVLLAGLYLAIDRWSLGDPWISATFAILFVLFGLTGAVCARVARGARREREATRHDAAGADIAPAASASPESAASPASIRRSARLPPPAGRRKESATGRRTLGHGALHRAAPAREVAL